MKTFESADPAALIRNPGAVSVVRGKKRAVCSSDNTIVTNAILRILDDGGNAADAAIAGCIVQATIEPFMTNHTGTVTMLYWEAKTKTLHALDSHGTVPHDLPPFKPVPGEVGGIYSTPGREPSGAIPAFMPGMKAIYERFGTRPWASLCEEAIYWADEGHPVSSFEHLVNAVTFEFITYFPEGRALFTADGFLPPVGSKFRNPELGKTLRRLRDEGPDCFITGSWARRFVETANRMGWEIKPDHMTATPPRWGDPVRYPHRGYEIAHLPLPQRQGVFCALVLGILDNVAKSYGPVDAADSVYAMAHALRMAQDLCGFVNDPQIFNVPLATYLDPAFHRALAQLIDRSRPKVDLRDHVRKTWGPARLAAAGVPYSRNGPAKQPAGSCELAIVDADGNWVQMMNTLQSGGIPGMVVDGVPMVGSHAAFGDLGEAINAWLAPGARMRSVIGNTIVLRDGKPAFSLGSPGNVHCTVPQVLANVIDRRMDFPDAVTAPRMLPLGNDYSLTIESRLPAETASQLASLGIKLKSDATYDFHMGSFQLAWRDEAGLLGACADPRRCGFADGRD
jgi:gamma-glutamyltranspeptidase / glutathione hydrolase